MAFYIFIIDDPFDQFVAQKVISSLYTGSQIETFSQASSALAKLQWMTQEDTAPFPYLIILDINMPIMNGFDFLEGFAQLPTFLLSKCKVIMLSSSLHYQDISIAMTYKEAFHWSRKLLGKTIKYSVQAEENKETKLLCISVYCLQPKLLFDKLSNTPQLIGKQLLNLAMDAAD